MQKVIVKARKEVLYVKYKYEVHGDESTVRSNTVTDVTNPEEKPCLALSLKG